MTISIEVSGPGGSKLAITIQTNHPAHSLLSERPRHLAQLRERIADAARKALEEQP